MCEPDGSCFYELTSPITIDTSDADPNYLNGKLAQGNFNFRHMSVAVNLIGTEIVDCLREPDNVLLRKRDARLHSFARGLRMSP